MKSKIEHAGSIELSGKVIASDPCYERKTWCMAEDISIKPGKYNAFIVKEDEKDFGIRVSSIIIVHSEYMISANSKWVPYPATIGVDSGQCGIFDDNIYPVDGSDQGEWNDNNSFYGECCALTLSDKHGGILRSQKGFVSSSGYGDGSYELFSVINNMERVALMLDFDLVNRRKVMKQLMKGNGGKNG